MRVGPADMASTQDQAVVIVLADGPCEGTESSLSCLYIPQAFFFFRARGARVGGVGVGGVFFLCRVGGIVLW